MEGELSSNQTEIDLYRKRLFAAQEHTVRLRHPDWTEDQIKARCKELQEYIIYKEENRPNNEKLH